jgi:hypothetical protein
VSQDFTYFLSTNINLLLHSVTYCIVHGQKICVLFFQILSFFPLWLYSPSLGLGRLHETFHFTSVTRSRTASSTPWTGDQLVARPLLPAPGDCDGEVGGMNGSLAGETEVLAENLH